MVDIKAIKSNSDYEAALAQAERLIALDPPVGTSEADRLEVLSVLIEHYEKREYPFASPDPVSAIEFRMEEQGLRQRDLVPMLGSRSRVSEVLSRRRPLTVPMIRALTDGLGIPASVLVGETSTTSHASDQANESIEWSRFPVQEMISRGWLGPRTRASGKKREDLVKEFFKRIAWEPTYALYRRRLHGAAVTDRTRYPVLAWTARLLFRAKEEFPDFPRFDPTKFSSEIVTELIRLSTFESGPKLAIEFLAKRGVVVIVEPKLRHSLIDGAALLTERGQAVIGMTLRYDRVDAFWFTLLHELAHVWRHLSRSDEGFVDRLESAAEDYREKEANRFARESLVPRAVWRRSTAFLVPSRESIQSLADELQVHPGIVVGRLHYETGNYRSFNEFLRRGSVRALFPEIRFE